MEVAAQIYDCVRTPAGTEEEEADEDCWVQCDRCDKWRLLLGVRSSQLPDEWFCEESMDPACASCAMPEADYD